VPRTMPWTSTRSDASVPLRSSAPTLRMSHPHALIHPLVL
jgi:hypothetical protein